MASPLTAEAKPIRAGVFVSATAAEETVADFIKAGFTEDEITVISSDEVKERRFRQFEHEKPAGSYAKLAGIVGGIAGAALGTTIAVATGFPGGRLAFVAMAALAAWTGTVLGAFIGLMFTRSVEKEPADYYDQAVQTGNVLLSVECHGDNAAERLAVAERIFLDHGTEPLPLMEG